MTDHGPSADGNVEAGRVSVAGGCGIPFGHQILLTDQGRPYIDCEFCAPKLVGSHYGWASSPAAVPLTPDEHAERDLAERDGVAMQRIVLKSVTDSLVGQATAQKSLVGQIKSLSAADRAELLAVLQGDAEAKAKPALLAGDEDKPVKPAAHATSRK
jgi:hypothetical protein